MSYSISGDQKIKIKIKTEIRLFNLRVTIKYNSLPKNKKKQNKYLSDRLFKKGTAQVQDSWFKPYTLKKIQVLICQQDQVH